MYSRYYWWLSKINSLVCEECYFKDENSDSGEEKSYEESSDSEEEKSYY